MSLIINSKVNCRFNKNCVGCKQGLQSSLLVDDVVLISWWSVPGDCRILVRRVGNGWWRNCGGHGYWRLSDLLDRSSTGSTAEVANGGSTFATA